jgi:hypothetical protein
VRLVRSKGVGVYFVTQNPLDIPDSVLAQLGNRVQHALRAFTPRDQKAVKATAQTMRQKPGLDIETAITELAVGEALVSLLDAKGRPGITERVYVLPPGSQIGPITPQQRQALIAGSLVAGVYEKAQDRESAYEKLLARTQATQAAQAEQAKKAEEGGGLMGGISDVLFGSTGPRGGQRDGLVQQVLKTRPATWRARCCAGRWAASWAARSADPRVTQRRPWIHSPRSCWAAAWLPLRCRPRTAAARPSPAPCWAPCPTWTASRWR